jgi:hypothetical protein
MMGDIVTWTPLKGFCDFWKEPTQQLGEGNMMTGKAFLWGSTRILM